MTLPMGTMAQRHRYLDGWHSVPSTEDAAMLVLESLAKSFYDPARGEIHAVRGLDATIVPGITAVVGANGAGKTTLLRLIATLLHPDRGHVCFDGLDSRRDAHQLRRRLGYLAAGSKLPPRLSPWEHLAHVAACFDLDPVLSRLRIETLIETFGIGEIRDQRIAALSTGQLQRVALARTLLPDPDLIVLDEPTTGLDILAAHQVVGSISALRRPGRVILLATHIAAEVEFLAERLLVMQGGSVVHDGPPGVLGTGADLSQALMHLIAPAEPAVAAPSQAGGVGEGQGDAGRTTTL